MAGTPSMTSPRAVTPADLEFQRDVLTLKERLPYYVLPLARPASSQPAA